MTIIIVGSFPPKFIRYASFGGLDGPKVCKSNFGNDWRNAETESFLSGRVLVAVCDWADCDNARFEFFSQSLKVTFVLS